MWVTGDVWAAGKFIFGIRTCFYSSFHFYLALFVYPYIFYRFQFLAFIYKYTYHRKRRYLVQKNRQKKFGKLPFNKKKTNTSGNIVGTKKETLVRVSNVNIN